MENPVFGITRRSLVLTALLLCAQSIFGETLGLFEDQGDVGTVLHPGSATFDSANGTYTISGSGENMWATTDAFHFVWKKYSGDDVAITADVSFVTKTGSPHKKAALMIRQSLDADSPYADAALHVVGLTSLQARPEKGGATHEVGIDGENAVRLRLVKRGDSFYMYVARKGEELHLAGGSMRVAMKAPFYIGLAVCAHDKDAEETAVFSDVSIGEPETGKPKLYSTLETISASSTDRRAVLVVPGRITDPTWSTDGNNLVFQLGKKTMQVAATGGTMEAAPERHAVEKAADGPQAANLSYTGKTPQEAELSVKTVADGKTKVLAHIVGGQGTLSAAPWSPDGKRLTYVSYQIIP